MTQQLSEQTQTIAEYDGWQKFADKYEKNVNHSTHFRVIYFFHYHTSLEEMASIYRKVLAELQTGTFARTMDKQHHINALHEAAKAMDCPLIFESVYAAIVFINESKTELS